MKLLGRDLRPEALLEKLEGRLRRRGISEAPLQPISVDGVEPRVDPAAFYLSALEGHADATVPLPLTSHRGGAVGRGVLLAKQLFRTLSHAAVVDMLGRQRLFNGYTRDAFGEVFERLEILQERLDALEAPPRSPTRKARTTAPRPRSTSPRPRAPKKPKRSR